MKKSGSSEERPIPEAVEITAHQATQMMVLSLMLKDGELEIRGDDQEQIKLAVYTITDVAEECALAIGGYIDGGTK